MRCIALCLVFLVATPPSEASGKRILALLATPSRSHHIWNRSLMLALAGRGHQVTVFSPDPEETPVPNLRDIVIEGAYEHIDDAFDYEEMDKLTSFQNVPLFFEWGSVGCDQAFNSRGGQSLIGLTKNETFDLIIVEAVLEDCFLGFVPKFGNPPVLAISAFGSHIWSSFSVGNPEFPSYIPHYSVPYSNNMSFLERLHNFLVQMYTLVYREWIHIPKHDEIVRKFLGEGIPSIRDLERNVSLILVNNNVALDFARPYVPAMVPVGGMHVRPSKPLPKDLKKFLDEAEAGVVYFSLGTNVRSDKLNPEKRQAILDAFSELPQRVLWKFESDEMAGKPRNVMLGKWLPQNDILGHPKVRLFITHAGLLSTQESVYHGIPMVGIPFLADQHINIQKSITHGIGVRLSFQSLTKETLLEAMRTVLNNASYKVNAEKLSRQFRDQTETPLERAVFWTEYVIRHGGAEHLRCISANMSFSRYFLLDVLSLFVLGAGLALLAVIVIIIIVFRACRRETKSDKNVKHKAH